MPFLSPVTALGPLGIYLVFLGVVNLSSKPRLLTGRQDFSALSLGISGLVIVGPMQVLLPETAMIRFGNNAWYPMVLLYLFCTTWLLLLSRPRLILYNLTKNEFLNLMENILSRNNWSVHWHGNVVQISEIGIQFEIISFTTTKNVALRATRFEQSLAGWRALRKTLLTELQTHQAGFNRFGSILILCGFAIALIGWAYTPFF